MKKKKYGWKRISTCQDERVLLRLWKEGRNKSSIELSAEMRERGVKMSSIIVRRRGSIPGTRYQGTKESQAYLKKMGKKRLRWAEQFQDWTEEDWTRVSFTDGSTIAIMEDNFQFVRRKPVEGFSSHCVKECMKHPAKLMVWCIIAIKWISRLYIMKGNMKQYEWIPGRSANKNAAIVEQ